ncbi:MAG TPA: GNAT family N-acetyltransferase [Gemmatimonadaceae bacterium]|nr:GNAT family N-acetyltransferase [Gemmatimonadaceae bacterium]
MAATIRLATPGDGPALAAIYAPAVTDHTTSFELEPPDGDEMARRVERLTGRTPWIVCEWRSNVIGYAYGGIHRDRWSYQWSVEVSAYVDASVHRRGVGRALYTSLFEVLGMQGYRNAYAGITLPNPASVRLHEAVGFTTVGTYHGIGYKFGAWHDVLWLERPLAPRIEEPGLPIPLPTIVGATQFPTALAAGTLFLRGLED